MSPGTKSLAFILCIPDLFCLNTFATSGSYSFNASIALSAFLSYKIDTKISLLAITLLTEISKFEILNYSLLYSLAKRQWLRLRSG